jgi:hypothetical protein
MWRNFLDSLDTPGGHIFMLVLLMSVGAGIVLLRIDYGKEILAGSFGALLYSMRGQVSNGGTRQ